MPKFGPGKLEIGDAGTKIEASCLVNSLTISVTKATSDPTTKLCGTVRPGRITYTYALSGNLDVDSDDPAGLFALSQAAPGSQLPFTFTPSLPGETSAAGVLIIDPLDFGGDEYGSDMTSDIEFDIVGAPVYTFPAAALEATTFKQIVVNGRGATPQVATTSHDVADDEGTPTTSHDVADDDELVDA